MKQKWTIRKAETQDIDIIARFNIEMAMETERKHLTPEIITGGVTRLMENPRFGFYIVAEWEGAVQASLMITYEWSDWRNGLFWWIQSVYVTPSARRRGGFRAMYQAVMEMAHETLDVCGVRLYVEKDNDSARQTYLSMGMNECHYSMYETEF